MTNLVLGIGSSHGPSIQARPEDWARLGDADARDPRFDYQQLLETAPQDIEEQIRIEKQRERHAAAHAALGVLRAALEQAKPDAIVIISNPHRVFPDESRTVFGVMRSRFHPVAQRTGFDPDIRFRSNEERPKPAISNRPGRPELANHLIAAMNDAGFDVGCSDGVREGYALDDAFAFAYDYLLDDAPVPTVPFMVSRYLPYQATSARCYALGQALRNAIESWSADARVAVIASGGLSHQIIDEELDRRVISALENNDIGALASLDKERLNRAPGTPETLNWIALAGAMSPRRMTLVDYLPCYRSLAGTGHGLTFGLWS